MCPIDTCLHEAIFDDLEGYFRHPCLKEFLLHKDEETDNNAKTQTQSHHPSNWMPSEGGDCYP